MTDEFEWFKSIPEDKSLSDCETISIMYEARIGGMPSARPISFWHYRRGEGELPRAFGFVRRNKEKGYGRILHVCLHAEKMKSGSKEWIHSIPFAKLTAEEFLALEEGEG